MLDPTATTPAPTSDTISPFGDDADILDTIAELLGDVVHLVAESDQGEVTGNIEHCQRLLGHLEDAEARERLTELLEAMGDVVGG